MRHTLTLLILTGFILFHGQSEAATQQLLVGTANDGLFSLEFDTVKRSFGTAKLVSNITNPSFIAKNRSGKYLYITDKDSSGKGGIGSYKWDKRTKKLKLINRLSSQGTGPTYVSLNKANTQLALANYDTGNLVVYDIDARTKALKPSPQVFQLNGSGPHPSRQRGPHAHWVQWSPNGRYVYVVDLGSDRVAGFSVNNSGRLSGEFTAIKSKAGAGPRHMIFHPKNSRVFIINELDNTLVRANTVNSGKFIEEQNISVLPANSSRANQAGHIDIKKNGKMLYTSQRGDNSIAVFNIASNGKLSLKQHVNSGGNWPRHFRIVEKHKALFVANQRGNNVALLNMDKKGMLKSTRTATSLTAPIFILAL